MDPQAAEQDHVRQREPLAASARPSIRAQLGLILLQLLGSIFLVAFEASVSPDVGSHIQQMQTPRMQRIHVASPQETNPLVTGPEIASLRAQSSDMYSAMQACVTDFDGYPHAEDTRVQLVVEYSDTAPSVYLAPAALAKTSLNDCLEDAARAHADLTSDTLRYVVFDDVTHRGLTDA